MRFKTFFIFIITAVFTFVGTASGAYRVVGNVYTLAMGNKNMANDEGMMKRNNFRFLLV